MESVKIDKRWFIEWHEGLDRQCVSQCFNEVGRNLDVM